MRELYDFFKMKLNRNQPTNKNKSSFLKSLNLLFGGTVILMSVCPLTKVFLGRELVFASRKPLPDPQKL